ncbi:MAG: hypothetical protein M1815_003933 [Lichina confinis]|nr:MAG: hypothetical protein M1815_003933 [Lichina confinis]
MGVPKFFRWLSERYPTISQLIAENRIPEFDCLYLDMNGIIHNCTHKDTDSPTFRLTEDKMFIAIFNYIEHLFGKIKPKQLFFMAVDGVAPRAKMNQQRSRRFRTALEAETAREKAIRQGIQMPKEEPFDSNCITPGTEFMAKLTRQLKYFINKKISEDVEWQGVEIVLSGHEVPGEGEHKIMEYIRLAKAQPNYDPNLRHCLYGLDADLIMLGLLSHDPHFCLLREEVTFGRQNQKKSKELEHQNFYLLHLCIVREFLELEFQELKEPGVLGFPFDMERIIDDFILMAFFVGNDFLPHLPNLHINEGALALMFKIYKSVLPKAGGYINERGNIDVGRLALLLDELSHVEFRFFEAENADASWFKGKQAGKVDVMDKGRKADSLVLTSSQKAIFGKVRSFVGGRFDGDAARKRVLDMPSTLPARDRKFVEDLADNLGLGWKTLKDEDDESFLQLRLPGKPGADNEGGDDDEDDDESEDEEAHLAIMRVVKRYENAPVVDLTAERAQADMESRYHARFLSWKDKYYTTKFGWDLKDEDELRKLAENYVQGLQWVLFYYYRGVASWGWFYGYHYSPMISDVKKGLGANVNFQLGQPFRPFQQLMGVLPDRSKSIVPEVYWDLMSSPESPIIDFYPRDFELDMNGKKMDWEAVVKIPFIEESRLLSAMATKDRLLSEYERARNEFGITLKFTHSSDLDFTYPSSLMGVFPDIDHCRCVLNTFELPTVEGLDFHVGLVEGVKLGGAALAGFPSMKTLPHHGALGFHSITVFQQESRNESMIVTVEDTDHGTKVERAKARLGKKVHIGYPFLQEAKVVRVSDELFDYVLEQEDGGLVIPVPHGPREIDQWRRKSERIESHYSKRLGIIVGNIESLVHVEMLRGLKMNEDGSVTKEYAHVEGMETDYATQIIVDDVISEDQRFLEKAALAIKDDFPVAARAFFLGEFNYGRPLEVLTHQNNKVDIWISILKGREGEFGREVAAAAEQLNPYTPSYNVARTLRLNPLVLSRITSSFMVSVDDQRLNLGLNLKFEARKLKVLGYSRREASGWSFSQKAIELVQQYMIQFPEFIAGIQRNPQGDIFVAEDFYPAETAKAKVKDIQAWLKSIEAKSFERVPLDAEQLDSELVMRIEAAADKALQNSAGVEGKKIKSVPRTALLKPADAEHRLGNQRFGLGDRVVYVQDSGKVPIATRGTVVGLTRTSRVTLLDIVFDVTFMSGSSLGDRCSPFRGSTVPVSSVLNLTNKQLVAGTKASAQQRAAQLQQQQSTPKRYGAPMGPGGQGQLVDAPQPNQLRGQWRDAVAGISSAPATPLAHRDRGGYRGGGTPTGGPWRGRGVYDDRSRGSATPAYANGGARDSPINGYGQGFRGGRGRGRGGFNTGNGADFERVSPADHVNATSYAAHASHDPLRDCTNASPSQRQYSHVPPPPSLDPRGGAGPRGSGGRGRGSGYRGRGSGVAQGQAPRGRGAPRRGGVTIANAAATATENGEADGTSAEAQEW